MAARVAEANGEGKSGVAGEAKWPFPFPFPLLLMEEEEPANAGLLVLKLVLRGRALVLDFT